MQSSAYKFYKVGYFMIFKSMSFFKFKFPDGETPSQPEIEEALGKLIFRRCLPTFVTSSGFFHPMAPITSIPDSKQVDENGDEIESEDSFQDDDAESTAVTHSIPQAVLFAVLTENKDIKKSELEIRKISKVRSVLGKDFKFTEQIVIKQMAQEYEQEIIEDMARKAFSSYSKVEAIFDFKTGHLIIGSTSSSAIDNLIGLLTRVFDNQISIVSAEPHVDLKRVMTLWMDDKSSLLPPKGFSLGGDCVLVDGENKKSKVTCANQDLSSEEIVSHIAEFHKQVTKLSMNFDNKFDFVLDEKFNFTKIRSGERFLSETDDLNPTSMPEMQDAHLSVTLEFLRDALDVLYAHFKEIGD